SSTDKHSFSASRAALDPKRPSGIDFDNWSTGKVNLNKSDLYIGERCAWFDLMPQVFDAGHKQCVTEDDIPLRDVFTSGWGPGERYTAVSFKPRRVNLKKMIPPPELLDPSNWGFSVAN